MTRRVEKIERAASTLRLLSMNRRGHWAKDDDVRDEWVDWGRVMGSIIRAKRGAMSVPVRIVVAVHWPDNRVRDSGNYAQTAKAIVDGLVRSRLIADDRDTFVVGPDMRRIPKIKGDPLMRVVVLIAETSIADEVSEITKMTDSTVERHDTESRSA